MYLVLLQASNATLEKSHTYSNEDQGVIDSPENPLIPSSWLVVG